MDTLKVTDTYVLFNGKVFKKNKNDYVCLCEGSLFINNSKPKQCKIENIGLSHIAISAIGLTSGLFLISYAFIAL